MKLIIVNIILGLAVLILGGYIIYGLVSKINKSISASENIIQPNIALAYVDKDGTMWVDVNGNLYYLCMSDNGTQKRLEMK
jgi:hypothetical protein